MKNIGTRSLTTQGLGGKLAPGWVLLKVQVECSPVQFSLTASRTCCLVILSGSNAILILVVYYSVVVLA